MKGTGFASAIAPKFSFGGKLAVIQDLSVNFENGSTNGFLATGPGGRRRRADQRPNQHRFGHQHRAIRCSMKARDPFPS